jgi:pimeloyl-ACP methyl ester carboxylesterase
MDGLSIRRAVLAGYDWGGRAACIVAALWPERVAGLVSITGYNIQNIATALQPASPDAEYRYWYQWYFHTERGRAGLSANRRPFCRKLWELWSPNYRFDDAEYERTAKSFDNPDFVEVSIHSYRHRYGAAKGDPAFEHIEVELARQPAITVPTIVLHGESDGVSPPAIFGTPRALFYRRVPTTRRTDRGSLPPTRGTRSGGASGSRAWLWMRITGPRRPADHRGYLPGHTGNAGQDLRLPARSLSACHAHL